MPCDRCGADAAGGCDLCGGRFCPEHARPEAHDCVGLLLQGEGADPPAGVVRPAESPPEPPVARAAAAVAVAAAVVLAAAAVWAAATGTLPGEGGAAIGGSGGGATPTPAVEELNRSEVARLVGAYVNQQRRAYDLPELRRDPRAAAAAADHADAMAADGAVHVVTGERARRHAGLDCPAAAEVTTAAYYGSGGPGAGGDRERYDSAWELARGIVLGAMDDPAARSALLNASAERLGVGTHVAADGRVTGTVLLCDRPSTPTPTPPSTAARAGA